VSTFPSGSIERPDLLIIEEEAITTESVIAPSHALDEFLSVQSWRYSIVKRVIDFAAALIMVLLLLIPGLIIAAAILLTSRGPVFYREQRIGRNGRLFRIWKFRSMYKNAPHLRHVGSFGSKSNLLEWRMRKDLKDPRISPVGGFLRRWSLDEIPQLFNVLRGEMSLIGPRPIVKQETTFYGKYLPHYLAVTPGMSGLWQVSGRSDVEYDKRAMLDAFYVETWSLRSDFDILLKTLPAVLSRSGAV
jgi:exopolysaccharide production protein ExoY